MPLKTYNDYRQRQDEIYKKLKDVTDPIEQKYQKCLDACDSAWDNCCGGCASAYPREEDWRLRIACTNGCDHTKAECEKECETQRSSELKSRKVTKLLDAADKLEDDAYKSGVILNELIISDRQLADLADQLRVGTFPPTPVAWVRTPDELCRALAKDRRAGVLTLVTYGLEGKIYLGGKPLSLAQLSGCAGMSVADVVRLEGESDGSIPMLAELEMLRKALGAPVPTQVRWKPSKPTISVAVAASDKRTEQIPSVLASGQDHFVTVKGAGEVRLEASVTPNTRANKDALKWTATGGTIKAAGLRASISRATPPSSPGQKVVIQVDSFASTKTIVVWVVWSELKAFTSGDSSVDHEILGKHGRRGRTASGRPRPMYELEANIDWIATIHPASIITDTDRPAIERQTAVAPPGGTVPHPSYGGWEVAIQERSKVFKSGATTPAVKDWDPSDGGHGFGADTSPYRPPLAGNLRWIRYLQDSDGADGNYERGRKHGRVFVRVQLGSQWYRCSENYLGRWHYFAKRSEGEWNHEPGRGHGDVLDFTNNGWGSANR